jgi:hypothetical protein
MIDAGGGVSVKLQIVGELCFCGGEYSHRIEYILCRHLGAL